MSYYGVDPAGSDLMTDSEYAAMRAADDLERADRILLHLELNARIATLCHTRSFASLSALYDFCSDDLEQQKGRPLAETGMVDALWRSCLAVWQQRAA